MMFNKKHTGRQPFYAIILLMVMMVQMGTKTLHLHHHAETVQIVCSECEHHQAHHWHLLNWDGESGDCPLCQLLTNPYTESTNVRFTVLTPEHQHFSFYYLASVTQEDRDAITLRGPPETSIII